MKNIEFLTDPKIIKTLAHPLRIRLVTALDGREASPSQLSKEMGVALGTVSYHVRTLEGMGLLELVGEEQQRGAVEHYYTTVQWVIPGDVWKTLPTPLKRAVNQSMLSQIGEDVSVAASSGAFDEPDAHLTRNSLTLDEEGARRLSGELSMLIDRMLVIEAESVERLRTSETCQPAAQANRFSLVLMLFGIPGSSAEQGPPPP